MTRDRLIRLLRWVVAVEVAIAVLLVVGVHTTSFVLDRVRPAPGALVSMLPSSAASPTVAARAGNPALTASTVVATAPADPAASPLAPTPAPVTPTASPTGQPPSPTANHAPVVVEPTAMATLPPTTVPTASPVPSPTPTTAAVVAPPVPATPAAAAPAPSMEGRPFSGARLLRTLEEHGFSLTLGAAASQGVHQALAVTATKGGTSLALTLLVYPSRTTAAAEWVLDTPALPRPDAPRQLAMGELAVFNENAVVLLQRNAPLTTSVLDAFLSLNP